MSQDRSDRLYISYKWWDGSVYVLCIGPKGLHRYNCMREFKEYPDIWAALHFLVITPGAVDNT